MPPDDTRVSDIIDMMLFKLNPNRLTYPYDEVVDMLLDIRNDFNGS